MQKKNLVFIARSLDGYIADKNGGIDWLTSIPNPDHDDAGFGSFMDNVDALVMGRKTFETVCGFEGEWPYKKPVFVLSKTLNSIPEKYKSKAGLIGGTIPEVLKQLNNSGYNRLYIDGGVTIQSFLKEDLIDEMIITTIPILLGGGAPLFSTLSKALEFEHVETKVFLNQMVQTYYKRKR
jgi:dihydrofolate reductase